jgi:hypothetical protein
MLTKTTPSFPFHFILLSHSAFGILTTHLAVRVAFGQSHAAKHAENNDEHKLVIHAFTGRVWCYKCDNFVAPDASPKLAEQIKKMTQPIEQVRARYSQREQKKVRTPGCV